MECLFAKTLYTGKKVTNNAYVSIENRQIAGVSLKKNRETGRRV